MMITKKKKKKSSTFQKLKLYNKNLKSADMVKHCHKVNDANFIK